MSYLALYRKYRPLTFGSMVGQEHITEVLKNQIKVNRISHAYIFNGTRGTGKTSTAKIFARAINCLNPKEGEPCNECENCRNILSGDATDVVEMDAASNNSVENIRSVRQEVMYAATSLKYRVYIIDEAHMLSTSAFNALLKTLEEPPENVVFILATTEEHKILPTILSRCVRFEFKKISEKDIYNSLKEVLDKENIKYEEAAVMYIAKVADGGMRDGLSILERCIDDSLKEVTYKKVLDTIGSVDQQVLEDLAGGMLTHDVEKVDNLCQTIIDGGKSLRNITSNLVSLFIEVMLYIATGDDKRISGELAEKAKGVTVTRLSYIINNLSNLDEEIRFSVTGNTIFKARLIEITVGEFVTDDNDILGKIKELELRIEKLEKTKDIVSNSEKRSVEKKIENKDISAITSNKEINKSSIAIESKEEKIKFKDIAKVVKAASDADNLKLYSALNDIDGFEENGRIIFETKNSFAYGVLKKEDVEQDLKKIIKDITGEDKNIQINLIKEAKKEASEFESFMTNSGVPFEVID